MRYLVTGGAGFIGSNIVHELVRRNHDVVVLDNLSTGKEENLKEVRKKIDVRNQSITDLPAVQFACKGADYVIHLAALASVPRSVQNPLETNCVNVDGTLNVLLAARDSKVRRFLFAAPHPLTAKLPNCQRSRRCRPRPFHPTASQNMLESFTLRCLAASTALRTLRCGFSMFSDRVRIPLRNIPASFRVLCWRDSRAEAGRVR